MLVGVSAKLRSEINLKNFEGGADSMVNTLFIKHIFFPSCKQTSTFLPRMSWPFTRSECVCPYPRVRNENLNVDHQWAVFLNRRNNALACALPQSR